MLKQLRQQIIYKLWKSYHDTSPDMQAIENALAQKDITICPLDHFAIIDLPFSFIVWPIDVSSYYKHSLKVNLGH